MRLRWCAKQGSAIQLAKQKYWYTPMPEGEDDTTLKMNQVLMADIKLEEILENNKLPKGCNK